VCWHPDRWYMGHYWTAAAIYEDWHFSIVVSGSYNERCVSGRFGLYQDMDGWGV
jgi:hypothetical protein